MKNRNNIGEYLTSLGLINKGVEVGVFKGEFSKEILSKWEGTLYMVDPWRLHWYDDWTLELVEEIQQAQ